MELYVAILAGGLSNRFLPLEEKNLFDFFGTPLVIYQIKRYSLFLKRAGLKPNFIVVGNEKNFVLIKKQLERYGLANCHLITQTLPNQSGAIISALRKATKKLPFLVINSNDIFSETLINDLIHVIKKNKPILTATKVNSYFPGGYLKVNQHHRIEKIVEKPEPSTVPSLYKLFRFVLDYFPDREMLESVLKTNSSLSYEDALNMMLNQHQFEMVLNDKPFTSLKYPWHVLEATNIFLNNIKESVVKSQELEPSSQIVGKVYITKGVKIGSYSKIIGPSYIGQNTIIGDNCLVRHSHIGANCLVGAHCEVARSYLGNKVKLHRNYIGDSVLGEETSFGANSLTANLRFNEEIIESAVNGNKLKTGLNKLGVITGSGVKIGVSACLMPGVKISKKKVVYPNQVIYKDL